MTQPSLILGAAAAFALSVLPLAASAGTSHSGYRPGHWQRSHDDQGVMRVYGGDAYRTPEPYVGGEFRTGLDVQTAREDVEYQDEYYETSDRYARTAATPCRSVCVAAYAPPPPPCVTQVRREVRYAAPRVTSREAVIEVEDGMEEYSDYYRETSDGGVYRRSHTYHDDCPCRQGHDDRDAGYNDRYDDHYEDGSDDRYDGRYDSYRSDEGRDVFGRY